ncbi:MAG: hypothetical protein A2W19_10115 [Spirochaetes bacterium RBG_16_49_21]|nr:MAG: hypothetical protein A2W19_10115 [Spirochaetes bacterium RBG_16_49_21]
MSEILHTEDESSSDSSKEYEIAFFYTNGNAERARQMIAGDLRDMSVIKGKFYSTTSLGAFIAFFNYQYLTLNSVYPVISASQTFSALDPDSDWITFEKHLVDSMGNDEHDDVLCTHFRNVFTAAFTLQFAGELQKLVQADDKSGINKFFMQFMQDRMGFQRAKMSVSCEFISSLDMELHSLTSRKITAYKEHKDDKDESEPRIEFEEDDGDVLKEKKVKLVLRGSLILSPIKGRDVGLLIIGDRIKVKIVDVSPRAVQVAKAFDAYDEDGIHPIVGRIVSIRRLAEGGYRIFVLIAKGIFVRIDETEENIKIAVDTSYLEERQHVDKMPKISVAVISLLSVILLSLIVLLILYFK